ncbi:MAG TPA: DUF3667 domain-containing protein [Flavobacterium sp.]|jgi:hypothetical protein
MKKNLRTDRTCLNCYSVVEKRFCTNCGQENTETRSSFGHLATHFAEDLTHYDNAFWKTIKYLLVRPGRLTIEYLEGKRQKFVPPVKLYIFINFLTFFLLSVLPFGSDDSTITIKEAGNETTIFKQDTIKRNVAFGSYKSVKELDSAEAAKPKAKKMSRLKYWVSRKMALVNQKYERDELRDAFSESFINTLPKVLFLYMPLFAFVLWLFHGKKWFYFDHGIFTLHYFSFLLLTFSFLLVMSSIGSYVDIVDDLSFFIFFILAGWWFFYFFRAHSRFYRERKSISRVKSLVMFFINLFFIIIFLVGGMLYSALRLA